MEFGWDNIKKHLSVVKCGYKLTKIQIDPVKSQTLETIWKHPLRYKTSFQIQNLMEYLKK